MPAIPDRLDIEIKQIIQHWDQEGNGQNDNGGNVQILERAARGSKKQMVALADGGFQKLQQRGNQIEKQHEGQMAPIFRKYLGVFGESNC